MVEEERREINTTALAVGGAVIAICGLGVYYIWTRQKLVDEYIYWIREWQREYTELVETGGIPACEGVLTESECLAVTNEGGTHGCIWYNKECISVLTWKGDNMKRIQDLLDDRGWLGYATDLIFAATGFVIAYGVYQLVRDIVKRYHERHPPPDAPPGETYKDATDGTWHPTEDHLADHYRDVHPTPGTDPDAWDEVWRDVQTLPQWIINLLAAFNLDGLEHWVEHGYGDLDPTAQLALKLLLGVAIVIVIALVGWWAGPAIYDKLMGILGKLDAIPA